MSISKVTSCPIHSEIPNVNNNLDTKGLTTSNFEGLSDREYFYYLMNIEAYPNFLPKAKDLAQKFLKNAQDLLDQNDSSLLPHYPRFTYSRETFIQRLDEIYKDLAKLVDDPLPNDDDNIFKTKDDMIERLRQFAPLNQTDGVWVRNVAKTGPIDKVSALLFCVWMDEIGNGNPEHNHANVYTNLLEKNNIKLPPVTSSDYANNLDLLDSAFTVPVFELAISQFTKEFYPEILGMTLYLEWEVLGTWPTVKLLNKFKIDSHFYKLHIAIDNAANGHGAKARQAIELYLDEVLERDGAEEVQIRWKRIWNGYVAFATTGTLANDLRDLLKNRQEEQTKNLLEKLSNKITKIIMAKKKYGSLNHGDRKLDSVCINRLFDEPENFKKLLIKERFIVPGNIEASRFFRLISFDGPMYNIFTEEEIQLWIEWTMALACDDKPSPIKPISELMIDCIENLKTKQKNAKPHNKIKLKNGDIEKSLSDWFEDSPITVMKVLANPINELIIPGSSGNSPFINDILTRDNRMTEAFCFVAPNSGDKTWKQIIIDWIDSNCPIPDEVIDESKISKNTSRKVKHLLLTSSLSDVAIDPRARIIGMGVVH